MREDAALVVLGRAGVEPNLAGLEVDLPPFEREDFGDEPPSGDVRERDTGRSSVGSASVRLR